MVWLSLGNGFKRALVGDNGYFDKLSNQEITLPTAGRHISHISFCRGRYSEKGHIVVIV
jgi:hypothetical protein